MRRRWFLIIPLLLLAAGVIAWWRYDRWRDHRFDAVILAAARQYGVEPALVKAVVWQESRFDPDARGLKQEIGLMQIRPLAAQEWAEAERLPALSAEQLADPRTNTLVGVWYLRKLLARYQKTDGPIPYALADYNAGRSNVLRWNKGAAGTNAVEFAHQIDFPGTRKYVFAVSRRYRHYQSEFVFVQVVAVSAMR